MVRETAATGRDPRTEMELAALKRIRDVASENLSDYQWAVQHYLSNATEVDQMERTNRIKVEYISGTAESLRAMVESIMAELDPSMEL